MPFASDAQRRLMYAAAEGRLSKKDGPSPEVAKKFIADSKTRKRRAKRIVDKATE